MEPVQLQFMPHRVKSKGKPIGRPIELATNLYGVTLRESKVFEQYRFETQPTVGDNEISLLRKLVSSKRQELQKMIGLRVFKGKMIWGDVKCDQPFILEVKKDEKAGLSSDYELLLKHTKSIGYYEIMDLPVKQRRQLLQIYGVALKEKLFGLGMKQTSRNRYIRPNTEIAVKDYKVLQCFDLKFVPIKRQIKLLIDLSFRVLDCKNALEVMGKLKTDEAINDLYAGKTIITTYNQMTYRFKRITKHTPAYAFDYHSRPTTVADYLRDHHGVHVTTMKQNLIQVVTGYSMEKTSNNQEVRVEKIGFLVPEFCKFSTQLESIRGAIGHEGFEKISREIKIRPQERVQRSEELINKMNQKKGQLEIKDDYRCHGLLLDRVELESKNKLEVKNAEMSSRQFGKVIEPMNLGRDEWLMVSSQNANPRDLQPEEVQQKLRHGSKIFGINIQKPEYLDIYQDSNAQQWIDDLQHLRRRTNGIDKIRIIVLLFRNNKEATLYGPLKAYITFVWRIPCQVILEKTFYKNQQVKAGKIALQMNAKLNKPLWVVNTLSPRFKAKKIIFGAIATNKNIRKNMRGSMSHALSIVGNIDAEARFRYCNSHMIKKPEQLLQSKTYEDLMANWFKQAKVTQKGPPETIIIYREGLTEKQFEDQGKAQIKGIRAIISRIQKRDPEYRPELIYIMVTKRSDKRIYYPKSQNQKFPQTQNVQPGTAVFEDLSEEKAFEFHMVAQNVREGTATTTQYTVAHHQVYDQKQRLSNEEEIAQVTHEQCYNYSNWMGAIKVPACLQGAEKLSRLMAEHICKDLIQEGQQIGALETTQFFL